MNRRAIPCFGLGVSLALHAVVLTLAARHLVTAPETPVRAADEPPVIQMTLVPPKPPTLPAPVDIRPVPEVRPAAGVPVARAVPTQPVPTTTALAPALHEPDSIAAADTSAAPRPLTSMAAPPAPTTEEWAFAARYTLKNSKGYRHTWGQQVRSMMGTAIEGPDQGSVRFRVEIGADGTLTRLETLWSTSPVAEQLAGHRKSAALAAHADRQAPGLREDPLVHTLRNRRPADLQGRLLARPPGIRQSVCLGWPFRPCACSGADRRAARPPGNGGLSQATAARLHRSRERPGSASDGPVGLGGEHARALNIESMGRCRV